MTIKKELEVISMCTEKIHKEGLKSKQWRVIVSHIIDIKKNDLTSAKDIDVILTQNSYTNVKPTDALSVMTTLFFSSIMNVFEQVAVRAYKKNWWDMPKTLDIIMEIYDDAIRPLSKNHMRNEIQKTLVDYIKNNA